MSAKIDSKTIAIRSAGMAMAQMDELLFNGNPPPPDINSQPIGRKLQESLTATIQLAIEAWAKREGLEVE